MVLVLLILLVTSSPLNAETASRETDEHTLANPLLFSDLPALPQLGTTARLLELPAQIGYQGDILYQKLESGGFRIRYDDLKQKSSFFWLLDSPLDARDRWFRLRYTGTYTPLKMILSFDHDETRNDSHFMLFLEPSRGNEDVYFKIPDRIGFKEVESLRFTLDPSSMGESSGDFTILGLDLIPADENPLQSAESGISHTFDHPLSILEADNRVSVNGGYAF